MTTCQRLSLGFLYLDNLRIPPPSLQFSRRRRATLSWVGSGQMGAPEPRPRQGGQICGGAAQPPPPWPPFLPPAPQYSPSPSAAAVSQFFSASCVPVNNPKSYPASLCALCVGDERGRNKCVGNSQERYYGYSGAFRYPGGPGGWAWGRHRGGDPPAHTHHGLCVAGA